MLGWEFPPLHSGGLGVATRNIALSLSRRGIPVCFALPHFVHSQWKNKGGTEHEFEVTSQNLNIEIARISSSLVTPYATVEGYSEWVREMGPTESMLYGKIYLPKLIVFPKKLQKWQRSVRFILFMHTTGLPFRGNAYQKQRNSFVAHVRYGNGSYWWTSE